MPPASLRTTGQLLVLGVLELELDDVEDPDESLFEVLDELEELDEEDSEGAAGALADPVERESVR